MCSGAEVQVQVVPEGIESVSGSSETMGCTSPLEDSGVVTVCRSQSYLVDGCSPDIDTSTSDWASHLVTVRRNEETLHFAHVLLTFGFETAMNLTGIDSTVLNREFVLLASLHMSIRSTTLPSPLRMRVFFSPSCTALPFIM